MTEKKTPFQTMFPGVEAEPRMQKKLLNLGKSYANYSRDARGLKWLLSVMGDKIPQEDKLALMVGEATAMMNCDFLTEKMDDAIMNLSCPARSSKAISSDLFFANRPVSALYDKYRREYWTTDLAKWTEDYKLAAPRVTLSRVKDKAFRNRDDEMLAESFWHIRENIKTAARELGREFKDVLMSIHCEMQACAPIPTLAERLKEIDARRAYAIYKKIEKQAARVKRMTAENGRIHLDTRDAAAKLLALERDFQKVSSISIREWDEKYWSMCDWKRKKSGKGK
ncbi:MAG: hypothetical protein LBJ73_02560 [Rickettsiales bacterium]|jgi:hypothetical protein|nr:hypothetical protein [Rickettsiales bacterium]